GLFVGGCSGSSAKPANAPVVAQNGDGSGAPAVGGNGATDPTPSPDPAPTPSPDPTPPPKAAPPQSLIDNADFFDAVHPYFWTLTSSGNVTQTSFTDDATIVATARAHNIKLMPLVYGTDDA